MYTCTLIRILCTRVVYAWSMCDAAESVPDIKQGRHDMIARGVVLRVLHTSPTTTYPTTNSHKHPLPFRDDPYRIYPYPPSTIDRTAYTNTNKHTLSRARIAGLGEVEKSYSLTSIALTVRFKV